MSLEGDEFKETLWAYRAVYTQDNVAGGTILINVVASERTLILWGLIGKDDYAADRTALVSIVDAGGDTIGITMKSSAIDNEWVPMISDSTISLVNEAGLQCHNRALLGKGDSLAIKVSALVQNETVTIAVRALVRNRLPTVNTTGSGGTVTVAIDMNKVI